MIEKKKELSCTFTVSDVINTLYDFDVMLTVHCLYSIFHTVSYPLHYKLNRPVHVCFHRLNFVMLKIPVPVEEFFTWE